MSTLVRPEIAATTRRVYCEDAQAEQLLSRHPERWETLPIPHPLPADDKQIAVIVSGSPAVFTPALRAAIQANQVRLVYILGAPPELPKEASGCPVFCFLTRPLQEVVVSSTVQSAFENLELARRQADLQSQLDRTRNEIDELNEIGIALSSQPDTATLLNLILRKSREITNSDAGSLYLVEENERGDKRLRFKLTQNDSIAAPFSESTMPINASSFAGYVALTGETLHLEDAYHSPASIPATFNPRFDQESGYRTRSMLVVPMKNPQGEILGVVQLINAKRSPELRVTAQTVDAVVIPYPEERRALVTSLASQAAVAIENSRLYESIQTLFEGFVKASVKAIESRDPTTSGHSFRVADLTIGLAEVVDRCDTHPFRDITFTRAEMKEIRYASLLHDFGKVGVREEVLVKAKKLYPKQLELVRNRFDFVRKAVQQRHTQRKLEYLLEKGREEYLARQAEFDRELQKQIEELDDYLQFVLHCNEPTVLPEGDFQRLAELASYRFEDWDGQSRPLLTEEESALLSIPKGSLDEKERVQIESHVVHTFEFLSQIPWTKEIRNIPLIARAHHEKLNGTGYPYKLSEAEIPFQAKMMTISDIYDALSASDRPYKKAVPSEKALDILAMEANHNLIDRSLFKLFVEAEVYKKTLNWKHPGAE
ncbi:MAG TPA: HD domain-containing phosphohydrolase [Terriglobia bacterium]|nr:HD domain-containing phosphohydrolase [Terriglobia bacterium]